MSHPLIEKQKAVLAASVEETKLALTNAVRKQQEIFGTVSKALLEIVVMHETLLTTISKEEKRLRELTETIEKLIERKRHLTEEEALAKKNLGIVLTDVATKDKSARDAATKAIRDAQAELNKILAEKRLLERELADGALATQKKLLADAVAKLEETKKYQVSLATLCDKLQVEKRTIETAVEKANESLKKILATEQLAKQKLQDIEVRHDEMTIDLDALAKHKVEMIEENEILSQENETLVQRRDLLQKNLANIVEKGQQLGGTLSEKDILEMQCKEDEQVRVRSKLSTKEPKYYIAKK